MKTSKCSRCNADIPADAAVCPYCGNRVIKNRQPEPDTQRKKKKNRLKMITAVSAVLSVCLLLSAAVSFIRFNSSSDKTDPFIGSFSTHAPAQTSAVLQTITPEPTDEPQPTDASESSDADTIAVGDYIYFGTYEQDNDTSNGAEPIEWRVLDVQDGQALVISKYGLDAQPYNEEFENVTWQTCTLRSWLNDDFYNTAFSGSVQDMIQTTSVVNDDNPDYGTEGGNDTQDKVFLLSLDEAEEYFADKEDRMCVPTAYAVAQGAGTSNSYIVGGAAACRWWLQSPGCLSYSAAFVYFDGSLSRSGTDVHCENICVRPALWISLDNADVITVNKGTSACDDSDGMTWSLELGTLTITGIGNMDAFKDENIDLPWKDYADSILEVVIEDGITTISDNAFYDYNLREITIPDSVTTIGKGAFSSCDSLTEITIPDSVTEIGDEAFYGCSELTDITIPDSVTEIGDKAFCSCHKLRDVVIPAGIITIGDGAFSGGDESICLDPENPYYTCIDDVLYTKDMTRIVCSFDNLTEFTIPDSVTTIGNSAFFGCDSLTEITIPDSVTTIGDYAFAWCDMTEITIPDSVTTIGDYAFAWCDKLTEITIPDSVTTIGDSAFFRCDSLTEITIPSNVTNIGDAAFSASADNIYVDPENPYYTCIDGVLYTKDMTKIVCSFDNLTEFTIPDSVTTIGDSAFFGCDSLTEITIPDSVTTIGDSAFRGCKSLTAIIVPAGITSIADETFSFCSSLKEITIPDSVTTIGEDAFSGCHSLTEITVPDGVTSIGDYTFAYCDSLKEITLPDSVTTIGSSAFSFCEKLTEITIPDSVAAIGNRAFYNCDNLNDVYYAGSENDWSEISIEDGNSCLRNASIHYNSN